MLIVEKMYIVRITSQLIKKLVKCLSVCVFVKKRDSHAYRACAKWAFKTFVIPNQIFAKDKLHTLYMISALPLAAPLVPFIQVAIPYLGKTKVENKEWNFILRFQASKYNSSTLHAIPISSFSHE